MAIISFGQSSEFLPRSEMSVARVRLPLRFGKFWSG